MYKCLRTYVHTANTRIMKIPTYEDCREICDANVAFIETKHCVGGYNISIFNYRNAKPKCFTNPISTKPEVTAFELRGLTFVFNSDGTLFERYILMKKFFNMDQSEQTHEKIKNVTFKEDGSIISFVKLPNNEIIAKSKASFVSHQAKGALKLFETIPIKTFVTYCLNNNIAPIFEYVSPDNKIILNYDKTDLVLIQLRNNLTGDYVSVSDLPSGIVEGITVVKSFDLTLDEVIAKCKTDKGYEGFVVTFESGKMIKLKLLDYMAKLNLPTENLRKENVIISLIVNGQIDDLPLELIDLVLGHISRECIGIRKLLDTFNGNKKDFAIANGKDKHFASAMQHLNQGVQVEEIVKKTLLHDTFTLKKARKWINKKKTVVIFQF